MIHLGGTRPDSTEAAEYIRDAGIETGIAAAVGWVTATATYIVSVWFNNSKFSYMDKINVSALINPINAAYCLAVHEAVDQLANFLFTHIFGEVAAGKRTVGAFRFAATIFLTGYITTLGLAITPSVEVAIAVILAARGVQAVFYTIFDTLEKRFNVDDSKRAYAPTHKTPIATAAEARRQEELRRVERSHSSSSSARA